MCFIIVNDAFILFFIKGFGLFPIWNQVYCMASKSFKIESLDKELRD